MSKGLPTIRELIAEGSATLREPFSRGALINWVSARRPDVGVSSIATHIQLATENAGNTGHHHLSGRRPLLHRVDRGLYRRYPRTGPDPHAVAGVATTEPGAGGAPSGRVVLIGSSGATAAAPMPVAHLFRSAGFTGAREYALHTGLRWFVLSAKHGLLDPDDVVGPYDLQIGDRSAGYRTMWGEWVATQLGERVRLQGLTVEVHGGVDFAQPLRHPLTRRGADLEIPLPGTWREAEPDRPGGQEDGDEARNGDPGEPDAPVRAALDRLRGLMHRHRGPGRDAPGGGGSAAGLDASAS